VFGWQIPLLYSGAGERLEESSGPQTTAGSVDWPIFSTAVGEDFAGSLPLEEPPGVTLQLQADALQSFASIAEEFGLPHPIEDGAAATWLLADAFVWSTSVAEDFAGSLPLEEPPGATWASAPDNLLAAISAEDFAGSLPLEEPAALTAFVSVDLLPSSASPGEEFGLPHPIEENTPAQFAVSDPAWVGPPIAPEDFAGSLPLEECSIPVVLFGVDAAPLSLFSDETFSPLPPSPTPPVIPFIPPPGMGSQAGGGPGSAGTGAGYDERAWTVLDSAIADRKLRELFEKVEKPVAAPIELWRPGSKEQSSTDDTLTVRLPSAEDDGPQVVIVEVPVERIVERVVVVQAQAPAPAQQAPAARYIGMPQALLAFAGVAVIAAGVVLVVRASSSTANSEPQMKKPKAKRRRRKRR
jgi:hypothetical protein